jgi:hypothetical protein
VEPSSADAGTVTVSVTLDNNTGSTRYGNITFTDADGLTTAIPVTQAVILPDDGKVVGYVYLSDDFNWVGCYGGEDEITKNFSGSTKNMHTQDAAGSCTSPASITFAGHSYVDINWAGNCFYFGAHYFKMGKNNYQSGLKVTAIPNTEADKVTNITLTFNATPSRASTAGSGFDDVLLRVAREGPGSVIVNDGATKESGDIDIQIPDNANTQWYWIEKSVVLYGVTANTSVTIKTNKTGTTSGYFRWLLNDIKFEKHSTVTP